MAKKPAPSDTSPSSSEGISSFSRDAGPSAGPSSKAIATDTLDGDVVRGDGTQDIQRSYDTTADSPHPEAQVQPPSDSAPVPPAPTPAPQATSVMSDITTPEAAVSALKNKVSVLHTTANNVSNFASLAFNEVEQLIADIRILTVYIRSHV